MTVTKRRRRPSTSVADLRRRLQEAEDTINAIREGHVEALVVSAPEGEQVFTLRSADQPYRLMVEQMREGALTVAADGTILYCNQRFAELIARGAFHHLRQRLDDLLFSVVDVLDFFHEGFAEIGWHVLSPSFDGTRRRDLL